MKTLDLNGEAARTWLRRPSLALAVAINRAVREPDEWFDDPDNLDRVARAIAAIDAMDDPVEAAAVLAPSGSPGTRIHRRE